MMASFRHGRSAARVPFPRRKPRVTLRSPRSTARALRRAASARTLVANRAALPHRSPPPTSIPATTPAARRRRWPSTAG